jgi:glycyl-tRNA synthetase
VLADQGILLEKSQRSQSILTQVKNLAEEVDGVVIEDPALVDEIANLVEAPGALRGAFDPGHLALPRPVLISVMKKHQRFFPVEREGKLLPYFITVANRPSSDDHANTSADIIIDGNEHVIRARFADADFFIKDDRKHSLEDFLPRLNTLSFQVKLGSMLDKTGRIVTLTEPLSTQLGLTAEQALAAQRAAQLCKADLATKMVVEMTSLQGVMGSFYALQSGESEAIADAIYEHYLPRFTGDILPATLPGLVVGLADRLDSLMGLFAVGLAPTGTKDPFALRRSALGLVQALIGTNQDFNLRAGITSTASLLPIPASPESQAACLTFMVERLRNLLLDSGNRYDIVDAILAAQGHNPARATQAVLDLARWVARPDWSSILPAYARCVRITRDLNEHYPVNLDAFTEHEERELFAALQTAEAAPRRLNNVDDFLNTFLPMIPVINRFFDAVLVMAEDVNLRQNRLGMLQRIAALADGVADLSRLEGF